MNRTIRIACVLGGLAAMAIGPGASLGDAEEVAVANPEGLDRAIRAARPGDTIVLADGTYRDVKIVFSARGEEGKPITLRAATPGKVALTGASRLQIAGHDLVVDGLSFRDGGVPSGNVVEFRRTSSDLATRCRLTRCAIVDYNPPDEKADTKWVSLYGRANRVDHCYFAGKTNSGPTLVVWVVTTPNDHVIDLNHFGPRIPLDANGGETVRVGTSEVSMSVSRTLVENNLFERCDGEIEAVSNKSCENVYRGNTFLNYAATLTLRHGNDCVVEGNFFLGNRTRGSGGVRIIGERHKVVNNYFAGLQGDGARSAISMQEGLPDSPLNGYYQVKGALVAFNTLVDNKANLAIGVGKGKANTLPPRNCLIANNLVVGRRAPLVNMLDEPPGLKWEGNLMFGADTGLPVTSGVALIDPKLTRAPDGLWRPAAKSPALGTAEGHYPAISEDIDGQPRDGKLDVGCDQRSDRPIVRRPWTPDDVGPDWRRGAKPDAGD